VGQALVMSLERKWRDIEQFLDPLEGVHLLHESRGRRWSVGHRLVARQVGDASLLIRAGFESREELFRDHPDTFWMRPELEAHMKVLADVAQGDLSAICEALEAAWRLQRGDLEQRQPEAP
jgi:hypothetical protein